MTNAMPMSALVSDLQRTVARRTNVDSQRWNKSPARAATTTSGVTTLHDLVASWVFPLYAIHWPTMQTRLTTPEAQAVFSMEIAKILATAKVTPNQIEYAARTAPLRKFYPYPVPRDWLELCEEFNTGGLPDTDAVMACFNKYSADRMLYDSPAKYPWPHPVMHWIVLDMRTAMKNRNLSETDLFKLAQKHLKRWSERVADGETIPIPVAQLPDMRRPPAPSRKHETNTSQMTGLAFRKAIQEKLRTDHDHCKEQTNHDSDDHQLAGDGC